MTPLLDAAGLAISGRLAPTGFAMGEQLVCLVGPNGSGKTSLLHALAGIGHPQGSVRIDGVDPKGLPPEQRSRLLAFAPASRDIAWPVSARDLIGLGLPASADRSGIEAAVEALELAPFLDRRVDRLSTGERSRILLARALAARPRLLLLDEPVANLDPYWQLRLMEILGGLAHGCGVLAAVHDLDLAARFADRLVLMEDGRIAADGAPEAVLSGPLVRRVFGIARSPEGWRAVSPSAGPRSSR
ncbi:MAG: ATP-binding cassette domain-containing protein [Allosphingosinicella sp.]